MNHHSSINHLEVIHHWRIPGWIPATTRKSVFNSTELNGGLKGPDPAGNDKAWLIDPMSLCNVSSVESAAAASNDEFIWVDRRRC